MSCIYLIRQGYKHIEIIHIGIISILQFDVLANFVTLQNIGFE